MHEKLGSLLLCALLITSGCMEKSPPDMDGDGIQDSEDVDVDGDGRLNNMEMRSFYAVQLHRMQCMGAY